MLSEVWYEITYRFPNFNGAAFEVWEWVSDTIRHFIMDVITYPCRYISKRGPADGIIWYQLMSTVTAGALVLHHQTINIRNTVGIPVIHDKFHEKLLINLNKVITKIILKCKISTHEQPETHGCLLNTEATDDLLLKQQAISIHSAD